MMAFDKAVEVLDDCAEMGVSGVQFTGGGEPTVHPRFFGMLEHAQGHGLATSLVTNGVQIGKHTNAHGALLAALSWARVSIDAGNAADYMKIRHVPVEHWDAAWRAVRTLRAASDMSARRHAPVVGVGFVVTPDNWMGVYDACQLAKAAGAHNIRISAQFSNEDEKPFLAFADDCAALCAAADRDFTDGAFVVYNRFTAKVGELKTHAPEAKRCGYQEMTTYVADDLRVYRCCLLSFNERGIVGSIKDRRFRDLWMDPARADEMRNFDARGCERCQFHPILKAIDYAITPDAPEHSEFV
jgi:MoaA/NifB/PqqE/SkfB family radical SAM enzyme